MFHLINQKVQRFIIKNSHFSRELICVISFWSILPKIKIFSIQNKFYFKLLVRHYILILIFNRYFDFWTVINHSKKYHWSSCEIYYKFDHLNFSKAFYHKSIVKFKLPHEKSVWNVECFIHLHFNLTTSLNHCKPRNLSQDLCFVDWKSWIWYLLNDVL